MWLLMGAGRASGLDCCSAARDRGRRRGAGARGATAGKSLWLWAAGAAPACWLRGGSTDGCDNMHAQGCLRAQAVLVEGCDGNALPDGRIPAALLERQRGGPPCRLIETLLARPAAWAPLLAMPGCMNKHPSSPHRAPEPSFSLRHPSVPCCSQ